MLDIELGKTKTPPPKNADRYDDLVSEPPFNPRSYAEDFWGSGSFDPFSNPNTNTWHQRNQEGNRTTLSISNIRSGSGTIDFRCLKGVKLL